MDEKNQPPEQCEYAQPERLQGDIVSSDCCHCIEPSHIGSSTDQGNQQVDPCRSTDEIDRRLVLGHLIPDKRFLIENGRDTGSRELAKLSKQLRAVSCVQAAIDAELAGDWEACQQNIGTALELLDGLFHNNPSDEVFDRVRQIVEENRIQTNIASRLAVFLQQLTYRQSTHDALPALLQFASDEDTPPEQNYDPKEIDRRLEEDEKRIDQICQEICNAFIDKIDLRKLEEILSETETISFYQSFKAEKLHEIIRKIEKNARLIVLLGDNNDVNMRLKTAHRLVELFLSLMDIKNSNTVIHSINMYRCSQLLIRFGNKRFSEFPIGKEIYMACLAHDLGKLAVPNDILNYQGQISHEQRREVEKHVSVSHRMLNSIFGNSEYERGVKLGVSDHHQNYDGEGYPRNLRKRGHELSVIGQMVSLLDVFEALTSDGRGYRSAIEAHEAMQKIRSEAHKKFNPIFVNFFILAFNSGALDPFFKNEGEDSQFNHNNPYPSVDLVEIEDMRRLLELYFGKIKHRVDK